MAEAAAAEQTAVAAEVPQTESPVVETPAVEDLAAETPATETPAAETPAAETPAAETPAAETPPAETPAAETPTAETPPAETPAAETPAAETPPAETPAAETPTAETPPAETPAAETPAAGTSVAECDTAAEAAPGNLNGRWRLVRSEQFDEFMKASGVGFVMRKLINSLGLTIEIEQDGDEFTFTSKTSLRQRVTTFKLGAEYPETNPMWGDKEFRVLAEWQGAKLVQRVVRGPGDDIPRSFEREIVNGELVITFRRGEAVARRYFKKI